MEKTLFEKNRGYVEAVSDSEREIRRLLGISEIDLDFSLEAIRVVLDGPKTLTVVNLSGSNEKLYVMLKQEGNHRVTWTNVQVRGGASMEPGKVDIVAIQGRMGYLVGILHTDFIDADFPD